MNVLYITYDGLTDPLGQSQVLPYVIGLSKKQFSFTILSFEKRDRFIEHRGIIQDIMDENNIKWVPLRYHKMFSVLATLYDLSVGFLTLKKIVRREKICIVHCRSYVSAVLGMWSKNKFKTKFIFDKRGFWVDERIGGGLIKKGILYNNLKKLEKRLVLQSDEIIALTRASVEELSTWDYVSKIEMEKINHITTCCSIKSLEKSFQIRLNRESNPFVFGYFGSIGPWHSKKEICSFVDRVYHTIPESKFFMIINWGREIFEEFIDEKGYDKSRFEIATLLHSEIPAAMAKIDIGFFFIPPTFAKIASSPTKMGEMLAAGIPIVTGHSIGDVDELVSTYNVGSIVREFDDNSFDLSIKSVVDLIKTDKEGTSVRCLKLANDYFSLEKGVDKYFEIYKKIGNA